MGSRSPGSVLLALVFKLGLQGQQLGKGRIGIRLAITATAGRTFRAGESAIVTALVVAIRPTLVERPAALRALAMRPPAFGALARRTIPLRTIPLGPVFARTLALALEALVAALIATRALLRLLLRSIARSIFAFRTRRSRRLAGVAVALALLVIAARTAFAPAVAAVMATPFLRTPTRMPDFEERLFGRCLGRCGLVRRNLGLNGFNGSSFRGRSFRRHGFGSRGFLSGRGLIGAGFRACINGLGGNVAGRLGSCFHRRFGSALFRSALLGLRRFGR